MLSVEDARAGIEANYLGMMDKLITDAGGNRIDGPIVDLSESDAETGRFPRTVVKPLDPAAYRIDVADYFLTQAQ